MHIINFINNKNIVLIDASYYLFHRYFATYRWFTFQKIELDIENIINNEVFINAFYKHLQNDIKKICKKWKTDTNNILFCVDCMRSDIWRNDLYDKYKASRTSSQNFNKNIFPQFYNFISNNLKIKSLNYGRLEADDIIYLMQNMLKPYVTQINQNTNSQSSIIIITNDNDFLQLIDNDLVQVYNMQFKDLKTRGTNDPRKDLMIKAIYGDRSDNIPKIGNGITKKLALTISSMSDDDMISYLKDNGLYDNFMKNMKLISFDNIPQEYVKAFYNNVNVVFT
jgi:5'-3' exonuclease